MMFTINELCDACCNDDIQTVREIVTSKMVDINKMRYNGFTPLIHAVIHNHTEIVRYLLTLSELQLDTRDRHGMTALHRACYRYNNIAVLRLLCKDRRCTSSVVNIKDGGGWTALTVAVYGGSLEIVKEVEKIKGVDFDSKTNSGRTLIELAKAMNRTVVLEYLRDKKKNTLRGMAASIVGKHLKNKKDIDALVDNLHILKCLKPIVADFIDN